MSFSPMVQSWVSNSVILVAREVNRLDYYKSSYTLSRKVQEGQLKRPCWLRVGYKPSERIPKDKVNKYI